MDFVTGARLQRADRGWRPTRVDLEAAPGSLRGRWVIAAGTYLVAFAGNGEEEPPRCLRHVQSLGCRRGTLSIVVDLRVPPAEGRGHIFIVRELIVQVWILERSQPLYQFLVTLERGFAFWSRFRSSPWLR
jgi:hypothetical protein